MPVTFIFLAAGLATTPLQADQAAAPSAVQQAIHAFQSVCLAQRTAGADATLAAMRNFPGATPMPDLPYGRTTLKVFTSGPVEFMLRPNRRRFGCFVAVPGGDSETAEAVAALNAVAGLTARTPRNRRDSSHEWDVTGSSDHVRVVSASERGGILINLEADSR